MATALSDFIAQIKICNTHEHMRKEADWIGEKPDILRELFENYVQADLLVAGLSGEALKQLINGDTNDVATRFAAAQKAWEAVQYTGYGEAVRTIAKKYLDLDELTPQTLAAAQQKLPSQWPAGGRLKILRDDGGHDHIQTDDFCWPCLPDTSGPDFFFYDLSWMGLCGGDLRYGGRPAGEDIHRETGIEVKNLASLNEAMAAIFKKYAPMAIAVKSQHAYGRTLLWKERSEAEASAALEKVLRKPEEFDVETRNCLGDYCWARGTELSIEHNLPFKVHTGYYAGSGYMEMDRLRAANMVPLIKKYPKARFVVMHVSYPYDDELVAIAKHYSQVWVDMCWAWSINPQTSRQFVRNFIHAAPANKLFGFGGDTGRPRASVAYGMQARRGLTKTLQAEVDDGDLTEKQAIEIAERVLQRNQRECFDIEGLRGRIRSELAKTA